MSKITLPYKGYGRIYCETSDDVAKVEAVIKELDEYEFDYMPPGMVAPFADYPRVIYTHKFSDMDMQASTAICWQRGIKIWVFDAGHDEFPNDATKKDIA